MITVTSTNHPLAAVPNLEAISSWQEGKSLWDLLNELGGLESIRDLPSGELRVVPAEAADRESAGGIVLTREALQRLLGIPSFAEFRHTLLHFLFDLKLEGVDEEERLGFYLSLADGWYDAKRFQGPGRTEESAELFRRVAQKSLALLIDKVFRNSSKLSDWPDWAALMTRETALDAVLKFAELEPEPSGVGCRVRNLGGASGLMRIKTHQRQAIEDFLYGLAEFAWGFQWSYDKKIRVPETRAMFDRKRPELVELLYGLGKLQEFFLEKGRPLCDRSLAKLEELALREQPLDLELRLNDDRLPIGVNAPTHWKPRNVEEAAALGSVPGLIALYYKNRKRTRAEIRRLIDLEISRQRIELELANARA